MTAQYMVLATHRGPGRPNQQQRHYSDDLRHALTVMDREIGKRDCVRVELWNSLETRDKLS